jgi:hypothetical protein
MKIRPNDLEISAGLARELYRKATEAGTDRTSVCMGMLGAALGRFRGRSQRFGAAHTSA